MALTVGRLNAGVILVVTASVVIGIGPLAHLLGSRYPPEDDTALNKPNVRRKA